MLDNMLKKFLSMSNTGWHMSLVYSG